MFGCLWVPIRSATITRKFCKYGPNAAIFLSSDLFLKKRTILNEIKQEKALVSGNTGL